MQSKDVKAFKRELENYNFYVERVKALDNLIEFCYHLLGGVKGCDPSKEPIHGGVPNKDREYKIRDEITHHEKNKALTLAKIDYIDEILSRMGEEPRNQIKSVYIDGNTMNNVSRKYYISKTTLQYRIDREIKRALAD